MGTARHIRFPTEMEKEIEAGIILDRRRDFTDEVVYLVGLGLEEAGLRREAIERDLGARRGSPSNDLGLVAEPQGQYLKPRQTKPKDFPVVGRGERDGVPARDSPKKKPSRRA